MTDNTYLRYECADAFGLTVDNNICSVPSSSKSLPFNHSVLTTAGSQILQWNVSTATLEHKFSSPSLDTIGSGEALIRDSITALAPSPIWDSRQGNMGSIATGWNTGAVRVFPAKASQENESYSHKGTKHNSKVYHSILEGTYGLTEPTIILQGHESAVQSLAYFPDGTKLASGASNGVLVIWDLVAETGLFRLLGHSNGITSLFFWGNHFLLSTSLDGLVKIWDLEGQCCTQTIASHNGQVWSGALIDGGKTDARCRFITGSVNGQVRVWKVELPSRRLEQEHEDKQGINDQSEPIAIPLVEMDDANNKDDVCHYMGTLPIPQNVATSNERVQSLQNFGSYIGVLHHSSKVVQIYQMRSYEESQRKKLRRLKRRREKQSKPEVETKGPKRGILDDEDDGNDNDPTINNDGGADSLDMSLSVNDIKASDEFEYIGAVRASHKVRGFSFCSVSHRGGTKIKLVCALSTNALEVHILKAETNDKNVKVVLNENVSLLDMYGHPTGIRSLAISSDDRWACTVSKNVTKIWNVAKRSCRQSLTPPEQTYGLCTAFLPGDTHVVVGTREGHLLLIDCNSGHVVFVEENAHDGAIWSLDVRRTVREGEALAIVTGSADKNVKFWNIEKQDEEPNHPVLVHTRTLQMSDDVVAVRYSHSPKKRLVFVATLDSTIKVFFDDSLKFFLSLYGHKLPVLAVDASDDDEILASSGADKAIKIWGLDFGDTHRTLYGHEDSVTDLKFVRRTHYFFTCSKDGTVRYWDGDRFEQILILHGHTAEVNCLAISKTGTFLLSGGMDRQVRVWERTEDIVFLDEERERELEHKFEKISREDEGTSKILNRKNQDMDVEDDQVGIEEQPQSEAAVKKSVLSIASGDRIMEGLERADQELNDTLAFKRSDGGSKRERMPNMLLLGLEPAQYVLWILRSVKSAELEQSLIVLSMSHVERLIYYLIVLLKSGHGVELCSRVAVFVITAHQKQVFATHKLRVPLSELRRLVRLRLREARDRIGFNIAALKAVGKVASSRRSAFYSPEAAENVWAGLGLGSDVAAALESKGKNRNNATTKV